MSTGCGAHLLGSRTAAAAGAVQGEGVQAEAVGTLRGGRRADRRVHPLVVGEVVAHARETVRRRERDLGFL